MEEHLVLCSDRNHFLHFLYENAFGRFLLKGFVRPSFSVFCGKILDSSLSVYFIPSFIRRNRINMQEYEVKKYASFNDFFTRKILPDLRPVDPDPSHLIAPCDGLLSIHRLSGTSVVPVKRSHYTIDELLKNEALAADYKDGFCLVFRLCVNHYHRYCYADSGTKGDNFFISGMLHTVRPVALNAFPVFVQNSREYTVIETASFGSVVQMEVGALMVGKIENYHRAGSVRRGQEKGRFLYGGSTVILLLKENTAVFPDWAIKASENGYEIPVRMGESVGRKIM